MNIEHIYSLVNRLNVTNGITNILNVVVTFNPLIAIKWKKMLKRAASLSIRSRFLLLDTALKLKWLIIDLQVSMDLH